jgi:hypothetical protein
VDFILLEDGISYMKSFLDYIFVQPFPWTWMLQDILAILLMVLVAAYIIKRNNHPIVAILEPVVFVFIYASIYENAAIVMGLYSYGRSLVMIGFVPASVPIIEVCVLICGFWLLEKTKLPKWSWPPIIGLFGMLQDFSLDPLAIRQIHTVGEVTSARWNWLINSTQVNILKIPVFNFPGWMLIMLFGSACLLVGRWWYRKSGYKVIVGLLYPFLTMFAALLLMISPISSLLLWLGPIFQKGGSIEWVMLAFHLLVPSAILVFLWRGRMFRPYTKDDLPVFIFPMVLHLSDILFTLIGGYTEILWIVLLATFVQGALLFYAWWRGRKLKPIPVTG